MASIRALDGQEADDCAGRSPTQGNSDTDDWTFVSTPSSSTLSSSNGVGLNATDHGAETRSKSLRRLCEQDASPQNVQPQAIEQTLADEQQQSIIEDTVSINGDDADDESDGMTEINLSDGGNFVATISGKIKTTDKTIRFAYPECNDSREQHLVHRHKLDGATPSNNKLSSSAAELVARLSSMQQTTAPSRSDKAPSSQLPAASTDQRQSRTTTHTLNVRLETACLIAVVLAAAIMHHRSNLQEDKSAAELNRKLRQILESSNRTFNFVYLDPSNHAYTELKLLEEEMIDCIRRENPNLEEIKQWLADDDRPSHDYNSTPNIKPFKGLVCYENETEWRKKFNRLKKNHHIDLSKILKQVRRQLTYEMLELHHPSLKFKLIINQLEYLDFIEQRRKDRNLERLKAENFELSRRVNSNPSNADEVNYKTSRYNHASSSQAEKIQQRRLTSNSLISLESENSRLRRENEALKASLAEKAGTIYIKQSIDLERCERENNAFRRFHHQVAQEVSKGLKQLNLHITDFGAILNERDDSLNLTPLAQTRGYLLRLVEEIGNMVNKNKDLKEELRESRLLNALVVQEAKVDLQAVQERDQTTLNEDDNGLEKNSSSKSNHHDGAAKTSISLNKAVDEVRRADELNSSKLSDRLTAQQMRDFKVNWLMKRAKLRERLRETPGESMISEPSPRFDRVLEGPAKLSRPSKPEDPKGHSGCNEFVYEHQDENRVHSSHQRKKFKHYMYYHNHNHKQQQNDHKPCKNNHNHHRPRDGH